MPMQNFGVTNKEHYGMLWYFLEWSIVIRAQQTLCNFYKPLFSGHPLLSGQLRGPEGVRLIEVLPYLKTARTEISACKPNKKLFRLPGSSYLHVNSPLATASFLFPTK